MADRASPMGVGVLMHAAIAREYRRLRTKGWAGLDAMRAARVSVRFAELEAAGLVRLNVVEDNNPYDASYVDTWDDVRPSDRKRFKADIERQVERYGTVGLVGEVLEAGRWHHIDSCWGFIGNDAEDNGHDTDIRASCIEALANYALDAIRGRATFAGTAGDP